MFSIFIAIALIGLVIWKGKSKSPYDQFPTDNDDVDHWRNLNN